MSEGGAQGGTRSGDGVARSGNAADPPQRQLGYAGTVLDQPIDLGFTFGSDDDYDIIARPFPRARRVGERRPRGEGEAAAGGDAGGSSNPSQDAGKPPGGNPGGRPKRATKDSSTVRREIDEW